MGTGGQYNILCSCSAVRSFFEIGLGVHAKCCCVLLRVRIPFFRRLEFVPTSRYTILAHTLRHSAAELYRLVQGLEIGVIDCTRNCLDGAQIRLYGSAPQGSSVRAFVQHQQVACPPSPRSRTANIGFHCCWHHCGVIVLASRLPLPCLQDVPEHYAPL